MPGSPDSAPGGPGLPRLLVLASTYPRWAGDPEPGFVHELCKRLARDFHVTALGPHAAGAKARDVLDGIEVVRYRYAPERWETLVNDGGIVTNLRRSSWKYLLVPTFVLMQFFTAWRLVRREQVDVIHAHWLLPQGLIAALLRLASRRKTAFVVTSHGADLYALNGRVADAFKRFVLRQASAATVVSRIMLDRLREVGADPDKVSVLPMGVDLATRFTPDPFVVRSGRELLFVGRLVEKKGLRHLIEAMPLVLQKVPDTHLTIAGFGPEEAALKVHVQRLGLQQAVTFLGACKQDELPALYRRAALFVAPFVQAESGDQEGLGLVLVEAAGCGCPIIAGDVPAVSDVLGSDAGKQVNPRDLGLLAGTILHALQNQADAREAAEALRKALLLRFDWQSVADRYRDVLSRAASAVPPR